MNRRTVKKLKENESSSRNSKDRKSMDVNDSLVSSGVESNKDGDEMTRRQIEAMKEVFQIPSIVEQILQEVENLSDLKQCRLVNSTWKETAAKVMLKRDSALVVLNLDSLTWKYQPFCFCDTDYCRRHPPLYHLEGEHDVRNDFTTLKKIMVKSTKFPCSTFVIYKGNLNDRYMKDFFKVVGKSIQNLKLIRVEGMSVKRFAMLLRLNCPNLETLYLEDGCIQWSPKDISFELPKLKMLDMKKISLNKQRYESPFKILASVIAPNLQFMRIFNLSRDWEAVVEAGKTHLIKELTFFKIGNADDLTKLEKLVQVGPQLETLKLGLCSSFNSLDCGEKSKWMKLIQKLFDLSKTTLKYFSFGGIQNVFGSLHFPQFPQLREIRIASRNANQQGVIYPYEILRDHISPNLQVIKGFNLYKDTEEVFRTGKIHCVKEMDFSLGMVNLEPLRLFVSVHPQLESVQLYGFWSVGIDLNRIRELTGLVEKLLELNKDTLRRFKFGGVGCVFVDMKFPKFFKLQSFEIGGDRGRIFPRGINLAETFPVLEILDLHECWDFDMDETWDKCFPPPDAFIGSLTSVKTLIFNQQFTEAAKRNFRTMCPNAKIVTAEGIDSDEDD